MMHNETLKLISFIQSQDGIGNKSELIKKVQEKFGLIKDRSVYYSEYYAIRFSYSSSTSFSNTVISLSNLQKYDDQPFIVCLVSPTKNILYLANTTFLHKVSHSSECLRSSKRPNCTIPFTFAHASCAEFGMTPFGSCYSVRCGESFFNTQL